MDPKPNNVTSGGPRPLSENQIPSAHHPLNSTPNRPLSEPQNDLIVSATASSEQLGSTILTAHDSTTSVQGFESVSDIFHGDASSGVPAAQQTGPNVSELVTDSEMAQDPAREKDVDMDTTHQNAYTQHDDGNQPVAQPNLNIQSSTGTEPTIQLVAQLLQAQQAGNLADVTSQLHGAQAEQLAEIIKLAWAVSNPSGAEQERPSAQLETGTDTDPDSSSNSESESAGANTEASGQEGCSSARRQSHASPRIQQMLDQDDNDIILIDEHVDVTGLNTIRLTTTWGDVLSKQKQTGRTASLP